MTIAVLGAGVIGVTTAYMLQQRGYDVVVVDRHAASARECSFANGGQLSYCYHPMVPSPELIKTTLKWLGKKDAPLLFRFRRDPDMWRWLLRWLGQSTWSKAELNQRTTLALGLYSREVMHEIIAAEEIAFNYETKGHLHVFASNHGLKAMHKMEQFKQEFGAEYQLLSREECIAREPMMHADDLVGGLFSGLDESGDINQFTEGLAAICKSRGVKFMYNTEVTGVVQEGSRVVALQTRAGDLAAEQYVLALGTGSRAVGKQLGIDLPIHPIKGYSLTIPEMEGEYPTHSVTDQANKVVITRLGNSVRVAGTAEFAGYDTSLTPHRIAMLKNMVSHRYPTLKSHVDVIEEWACLRPCTPDGPPIIGRSPIENMYLNTGHGTLGWTQATGSAALLADIIDGADPKINMERLTFDRF